MTQDRRTFIKQSGAVVGVAITGVPTGSARPTADPAEAATSSAGSSVVPSRELDADVLRALAEVVLPGEIGDAELNEAATQFRLWAEDYEPVSEMNHGYGTSEIVYGPPDPLPGWTAQLEAMDLEARKRTGLGFVDLDPSGRRDVLERQRLEAGANLPDPLRAGHVAVALMAHWFRSGRAKDLCYDRRLAERLCRGIDTARAEPEAL